ncbi:MAG: MFS transporter [Candidatus Sumerlaeota bacterium]|nr:MFS transporter [Candidatus Sumerlaeota bacterium]
MESTSRQHRVSSERPLLLPAPSAVSFRNRFLVLGFLNMLAYAISCTILGPCVTTVEAAFRISHAAMWPLFAAGSVGYLAGVPMAGWMARRWGLRATLIAALILMGAGMLLVAGSRVWALCVAGYGAAGVGGGWMEPAIVAAVQGLFPERRRGALNLTQVGFGLGAVIGPYLANRILGAHANWRWLFVISGAAFLALPPFFPRGEIPEGRHESEAKGEPRMRAHANPALYLMFLALLFYVGGELAINSWSSAFFELTRHVSKAAASLAPLSLWAGILIGRAAMWFVSDRVRSRRLLLVCAVLGVSCSAAALWTTRIALAYGLLGIAGLGLGPMWPTIVDHSSDRLRTFSPRVLSWVIWGGGFGALSQAALGPVAQKWSLQAAMGGAVALLVGMAACLVVDKIVETRQRA